MQLRTTHRDLKIEFEVIYYNERLARSRQHDNRHWVSALFFFFSRILENLIARSLRVRAPTFRRVGTYRVQQEDKKRNNVTFVWAVVFGRGVEKRRSGEAEKRRSGEAEKRRSGEAEKRRSGEAEKRRSGEAEKRRSGEAEKRRSGEAEKRRSGEAEKRRSGEAEKRRSGEAEKSGFSYLWPRSQ